MRSEKEMMELILSVARKDERIRAVYMNGSRTNPNVKKDIFQDYDIVYVVKENRPFYEDERWIDRFGERLYMQCPEKMDKDRGQAVDLDQCFGWLMQFQDGNRLDTACCPVEKANVMEDKLCVILLDKTIFSHRSSRRQMRITGSESLQSRSFWLVQMSSGGASTMWQKDCGGKKFPMYTQCIRKEVTPSFLKCLTGKSDMKMDFVCPPEKHRNI